MYKLNPHFPLLWRTPLSVQFGFNTPLYVLENISPAQENFIAALQIGFSDVQLSSIATECGTSEHDAHSLVEKLLPVCQPPLSVKKLRICLDGSGDVVETLGRLLLAQGHKVTMASARNNIPCDLAIVFGDFVQEPSHVGDWLRREIPHLLVTSGDSYVEIGPAVTSAPDSPCAQCVFMAACDLDPSLPAMAAQIYHTPSPILNSLMCTEIATIITRWLTPASWVDISSTQGLRIHAVGGETESVSFRVHPECSCRALPQNEILLAS